MSTKKKSRLTHREAAEKLKEIRKPATMDLDDVAFELKIEKVNKHQQREAVREVCAAAGLEITIIPGLKNKAERVNRKAFERYFDLIDDKDSPL